MGNFDLYNAKLKTAMLLIFSLHSLSYIPENYNFVYCLFLFQIGRILNMGHRFSGEGFDDMTTEDDINEIIYAAEDLNEEELIL